MAAPTLVLLHAFPLHSGIYSESGQKLAGDARILAPDFQGFGTTPLDAAHPSLDVLADDVALLLDREDVDRAVIGGTSMGGYVALAMLRRHPDRISGLILANTKAEADTAEAVDNRLRMADRVEREESVQVLHDDVEPKLLGASTIATRPDLVRKVHDLVGKASPRAVSWAQRAMAERPDSRPTLAGCVVPTLVIAGDEDALMTLPSAQAMVDAIEGAQLERLPRVGHLSCLEEPDGWSAAVRRFLSKLD